MHVVELSNHPGDMLGDAARRRRATEQRMLSVHEDELVRYRARVQRAAIGNPIRRDHEYDGKRRGTRHPRAR